MKPPNAGYVAEKEADIYKKIGQLLKRREKLKVPSFSWERKEKQRK